MIFAAVPRGGIEFHEGVGSLLPGCLREGDFPHPAGRTVGKHGRFIRLYRQGSAFDRIAAFAPDARLRRRVDRERRGIRSLPGCGDENRHRRFARVEVDRVRVGTGGGEEVHRFDLLLRKRVFPRGDISADLLRQIRAQNARHRVGEIAAVPPVSDVDARNQRIVDGASARIVHAVAARFGAVPRGGVQEEEAAESAVDRDAARRVREIRAFGAAEDDAAFAAVLRRIDDFEQHAGGLLPAERHVAEVVAALIGPAALAVVVGFVGEAAVRMSGQVDRNEVLFDCRKTAVLIGRERLDFVETSGSEHVFEHVAQVGRCRALLAPERGRAELRPEDGALADGRFEDRGLDAASAEHRPLDGQRIDRERRDAARDHEAVLCPAPGVEILLREPFEYRMGRVDEVDERVAARQDGHIVDGRAGDVALFQHEQRSALPHPVEEGRDNHRRV